MEKLQVKRIIIPVILAVVFCLDPAEAQMTRNELLKKYYQITKLQEKGEYAKAIAICEEISAMYPSLPDTYLRMAQIYDAAGEESNALLMYGQYASLEMDDDAVAEYLPRINYLKEKYKIPDEAIEARLMPDSISSLLSDSAEINPMALAMRAEISSEEILPSSDYEMLQVEELSIPESKIDSLLPGFSRQEYSQDAIENLRNIPLWAVDMGDIFDQYGLVKTAAATSSPHPAGVITTDFVKGKWISSIDDDDTGREYFIINMLSMGTTTEAVIESNSGIFHQNTDILTASWKTIQSIWSPAARHFDVKELKDNAATCTVKDGGLSVRFELEKKKKTDYVKLSKNVLSLVTQFIPLGTFASKLSDAIFSYVQEKQTATTYQTVLMFNMKALTDNVLSCVYTISELRTGNSKEKEILIERKQCLFYRCPDDYQYFYHSSDNGSRDSYKALYHKLQSESSDDVDLNFPLAYMNYYGVGTKRSLPYSLGKMQTFANKTGSNRARYWLASVCYNLSMDESHYPVRTIRKQFRNMSDDRIAEMSSNGCPYVYGLQGDILSSSDKNSRQAIALYEKGALEGDPYCLYQLGMAYQTGQLVTRNPEKAYSYFAESASKGYPDAYTQLAGCYKNGIGVDRDYSQYINKLYEAISHSSISAIKELSDACFLGTGVQYDFEQAIRLKEIYHSVKDDIWKGVLRQYGYNTENLL